MKVDENGKKLQQNKPEINKKIYKLWNLKLFNEFLETCRKSLMVRRYIRKIQVSFLAIFSEFNL